MENCKQFTLIGGEICAHDATTSLSEILRQYRDREIENPEFQAPRKNAWGKKKIEAYLKTIRELDHDTMPLGTFVIFQVKADPSKKLYILDGRQRLDSLLAGIAKDDRLLDVIKRVSCAVQWRVYSGWPDAVKWFQWVNKGTALSSYEFHGATLTLIPDYVHIVKPQIEKIHAALKTLHDRFEVKEPARMTEQTIKRHDIFMFQEFWLGKLWTTWMKDKSEEHITAEKILYKELQDKKNIICLELEVQKFIKRIEDLGTVIKEEMIKQNKSIKTISITCIRNLIEVDFWLKHAGGYSFEDYKKIVIQVISNVVSAGKLIMNNEEIITLGLGSGVRKIRRFANDRGIIIYERKTRKKSSQITRIGYDNHHELPFSKFGDGPTVEIPSLENKSIGNKCLIGQ